MKKLSFLLLLFCLHTACEPTVFTIPTPAMMPTIEVGQKVRLLPEETPGRGELVMFFTGSEEETFMFRLAGLPGDSLKIVNTEVFVNNRPFMGDWKIYRPYKFDSDIYIKDKFFEEQGFTDYIQANAFVQYNLVHTSEEKAKGLAKFDFIKSIEPYIEQVGESRINQAFTEAGWSADFFGPFYIPKKGSEIVWNEKNESLYGNLVKKYENGQPIDNQIYTFTKDYIFVLGDNRGHSMDSRYLGLIPSENIKGKVILN